MSLKQKIKSLSTQQRKFGAAKHSTDDAQLKKTLEHKQDMMKRRIGRLQAEEKTTRS